MEKYEKNKITFVNDKALSTSEIREIFSEFGCITEIKEHGRRVFIRFHNESEATNALNSRKQKMLGLSLAFRNPRRRISYFNAREIRSRNHDLSDSDTKIDSSPTPSVMSSSSTDNFDTSMDGIRRNRSLTKNDISGLPALIDSRSIPVLHSIILGNLPELYTLEDVRSLVEEIHPIGFSKLEHTPRRKLRFCEVYLRGQDDVSYLTGKLDNFVISGKRLIAVEPSALLSRKIWNI